MFFFFSSRRRHTRLQGDWSSDVCSSDLRTTNVKPAQPCRICCPFPCAAIEAVMGQLPRKPAVTPTKPKSPLIPQPLATSECGCPQALVLSYEYENTGAVSIPKLMQFRTTLAHQPTKNAERTQNPVPDPGGRKAAPAPPFRNPCTIPNNFAQHQMKNPDRPQKRGANAKRSHQTHQPPAPSHYPPATVAARPPANRAFPFAVQWIA